MVTCDFIIKRVISVENWDDKFDFKAKGKECGD
jgi:hypothetical protein